MVSLNSKILHEKEGILHEKSNINEIANQTLDSIKSLKKSRTKNKSLISSLIIILKKPFHLSHRKKSNNKNENENSSLTQTQNTVDIEHSKSHIIVNDSSGLSLHHNFSKTSNIQSNSNNFIVDLQSSTDTNENEIKPKISLKLKKKKSYKKETKKTKKDNFIYKKFDVKKIFKKKKPEIYSAVEITDNTTQISPIENKNESLKVEIIGNSTVSAATSTIDENMKSSKKPNDEIEIKFNDNKKQFNTNFNSSLKNNNYISQNNESNLNSIIGLDAGTMQVGSVPNHEKIFQQNILTNTNELVKFDSIIDNDPFNPHQEMINNEKQNLQMESQSNSVMIPSTTGEYMEDEIKIYCGLPDNSLNSCRSVVEKVSQYFSDNIACFWSIFPLNEPHQRMGNWKLGEFLDRWFRSNYENCVREISSMISTPDQFLIEKLLKFQLKSCSWTAHNNTLQYTLIRLCMEKEDDQHINLLLRYFIVPPHLWSRVSYFIAELLDFASGIYPDYDIIVSELTDSYDLVHRMNPVQLCLTSIYMGTTIIPKRKRPSIFRNTINEELYDHEYSLLELMACLVIENCMKKFCQIEINKYLMKQYAPILISITDSSLNSFNIGLSSLNNDYIYSTNNVSNGGIDDNPIGIPMYLLHEQNSFDISNHCIDMKDEDDSENDDSSMTRPSFSFNQKGKEFDYEMIPYPPFDKYLPSISNASQAKASSQKDKKGTEKMEAISVTENIDLPNAKNQLMKPISFPEVKSVNYTSFNKNCLIGIEKDPLDTLDRLKEDDRMDSTSPQDNIIVSSATPATVERILNDGGGIEEININDKLVKNKIIPMNTHFQNDVNDYKIKDNNKTINNTVLLSNPQNVNNSKEENSKFASEEYRQELIELDKLTQTTQQQQQQQQLHLSIDQSLNVKCNDNGISKENDPKGKSSKISIKMIPSQSLIKDKKENSRLEAVNPSFEPNVPYRNFEELNSELISQNNKVISQVTVDDTILENVFKDDDGKVKGKELEKEEEEEEEEKKEQRQEQNINSKDNIVTGSVNDSINSSVSYSERHSFNIRNNLSLSSEYSQLRRSTQSINIINSSSHLTDNHNSRHTVSRIGSMDTINHYLYGDSHYKRLYKDMEENEDEDESDFDRNTNYTDLGIKRNLSEGLSSFDISIHCPSFYSYSLGKGKVPFSSSASLSSSTSSSSIEDDNNDDSLPNYSFISVLSSKPSISAKSVKDSTNNKVVFHEIASSVTSSKPNGGLVGIPKNYLNSTSSQNIQNPNRIAVNDSRNQLNSNKSTNKCIPSKSNVVNENQLNSNDNGYSINNNINSNVTHNNINNDNENNGNHGNIIINNKNPTNNENANINNTNKINTINNNSSTFSSTFEKQNFDLYFSSYNYYTLLETIERINPNLDEKVVKALEMADYYQHGTSINDYYENYSMDHLDELEELLKYFHIFDMKQIQNNIMNWVDLLISKE
ncbi:hypothetical protein LY90DRAFT_506320 [Neocallimastix californiae]|uniref:Uncharacterized protein n=1 Tax=Neocallimastix californiae TaxID=1754190 RepID=A0A1Y2DHR8_9FUNG|nr:hypothetical protein LY90DRAFT_506320 [Neocallimastix californiae]|eukprot:ORY58325.1 hypothetical protein LY90DRAFT_506320 [Neocallimastix californiae]